MLGQPTVIGNIRVRNVIMWRRCVVGLFGIAFALDCGGGGSTGNAVSGMSDASMGVGSGGPSSTGAAGGAASGSVSGSGAIGSTSGSGSASGSGAIGSTSGSGSSSGSGSASGGGEAQSADAGAMPTGTEAGVGTQPAANCPAPTLTVGDNNFTLASANGTTYTYTITIPQGYDPNKLTPVTIFWHALDVGPEVTRSTTDIDQVATNFGNVMVYPSSSDLSWNAGGCCTQETGAPRRDETVFAKELIAAVQSKVCADPKRIYTMGFSNGGMLTQLLACKMSDVFAAAAPSASALTIPTSQCMPSRSIPMYMINGTADPLVSYSTGSLTIGSISVTDTFAFWSTADQCSGMPVNTLTKGAVSCSTYKQCAGGALVTLCTAQGMGHCEPGMTPESPTNCYTEKGVSLGPPNNDIDGTQTSMQFLQAFSLP
jgi:polyhydroxybutyrate depolymerase